MRRHPAIPTFKALGVPLRLVVFQRVSRRPSTASELARELPIGRAAVVQHLTVLKRLGLVDARSEGRNRIYRAVKPGLGPLREWLENYG
ncbi:MAG TPA: metalloregulator ArsR/SmtB family transcription factor [Rhizomicrobium sp.]|nr:metalloregulator ArsR/SmtB family transcription factor [Rhizomicrobium sp.]